MNVGELKRALRDVPDDTEVRVRRWGSDNGLFMRHTVVSIQSKPLRFRSYHVLDPISRYLAINIKERADDDEGGPWESIDEDPADAKVVYRDSDSIFVESLGVDGVIGLPVLEEDCVPSITHPRRCATHGDLPLYPDGECIEGKKR